MDKYIYDNKNGNGRKLMCFLPFGYIVVILWSSLY